MIEEKYKWIKKKDESINICNKFENSVEKSIHSHKTILAIVIGSSRRCNSYGVSECIYYRSIWPKSWWR